MRGYWNDPEATAAAVTDGWLYTGDLGQLDEDGLLQVVDRKKSMFISGGLNVYPAEIERVIDAHPSVLESAAFGLPHERWGEACAVVVRGVNGPVAADAIIAHCRAQLSDYKCPKTVFQTSEPLPRGMSGKIVRAELARLYATTP
jgi:fatty-acyl-CoA synthase